MSSYWLLNMHWVLPLCRTQQKDYRKFNGSARSIVIKAGICFISIIFKNKKPISVERTSGEWTPTPGKALKKSIEPLLELLAHLEIENFEPSMTRLPQKSTQPDRKSVV